jgi:hypothetical protein
MSDILGGTDIANPKHYQIFRTWRHVLTTKFGNFSIRDKDKTEVESKMEIVSEIEKGSAKVRIGCDRDRHGPSWTRLVD